MDKQAIERILDSWFRFKEWNSFKKEPIYFESTLEDFATFKIYMNFKEFLLDHDFYLENDEERLDIDVILSNQDSFKQFVEERLFMSEFYGLHYENINLPFLFGEAKKDVEPVLYFEYLDDINDEADLISFINEVLSDLGEVTHSTGVKPQYEVIGVDLGK